MRRIVVVLAVVAAVGGYFFFQNYRIDGLDGIQLVSRDAAGASEPSDAGPPITRTSETIRVASFNAHVLGPTKMDKPHVVNLLARIIRQFDVVAVQEICSRSDDILPRLINSVNSAGRHYDFVIGPRLGRTSHTEQYAFIFDTASVEVDRSQLYTIEDPDDLLHRPPFVGWFRVRGPEPDRAFTFTLVNVHTDPDEVASEINVLDDVLRLVRDDGRSEDDVILLGDFNTDEHHLGELASLPGIAWAVHGLPTNTRQTAQYDNLLFQQPITAEFTGQAGVLDFMRLYNLTLEEALEVSDHLPVWGEFSIYEGGVAGSIAQLP